MEKKRWTLRDWARAKLGHPSPKQVEEAKERMDRLRLLTFEVDLGTGWRQIRIGNHMPLYNYVKPELSMLIFRAIPVIATPYLSKIGGSFYLTLDGLTAGKITWIPGKSQNYLTGRNELLRPEHARECEFRCVTREAGIWLHRELAKACGMRFREHDIGGHVRYTRDP